MHNNVLNPSLISSRAELRRLLSLEVFVVTGRSGTTNGQFDCSYRGDEHSPSVIDRT